MNAFRRCTAPACLIVPLLLMLLVLAAGLLAGCGSSEGVATTIPAATATGPAAPSTTPGDPVTFTDQAGRAVTIPAVIDTVYGTSPIATNLLYMLAPDKLAGWNFEPVTVEKQYLLPQYASLPNLGGWYGKNNTGSIEEIIKVAPDIILNVGTIDDTAKAQSEKIQEQLKIPVVMVDGSLVNSGDTFRYVGALLGVEERAEELAAYCDGVIQEAEANAAQLSESQKVAVYYAEGNKGLNTDPSGSMHTEVLDLLGAVNVAQVSNASGYGMADVSLEQVVAWDPAVILVASDPTQETAVWQHVTSSSDWSVIAAVKNNAVYQIPHGPFDWFDRPPCTARILGIRWVGSLLYPDLCQYDMKAEVRKFYELFYQIDLTDEQLAALTVNAGVK